MNGKIVMIGSMKGGVSKTVTTFNLAYSLSKLGKKVLAVDFDSQANLSMVRRYLTKTVEPKDRPMNIKVAEKISKKYFKGKDQKTIDDILEKALAAWFAAEGRADV